MHVVTGAGSIGTTTALHLAEQGRPVRLISRRGTGPDHPLIERVAADATDTARLTGLIRDTEALINCACPPYDRWRTEFPALAASLLRAVEDTGVPYVMLGNHYGVGAVTGPINEGRPAAPSTTKGVVRARIWEDAQASGVSVCEVRSSDFIGAGGLSLFGLITAPALLAGAPARYPGDLDVPHSWSFVGDVARTLVAAAADDRSWSRVWHVPSTATVSVRELAVGLTGVPEPDLEPLTAEEIAALGETDPVVAEISEMFYLFDQPFIVDSEETEALLGLKPTPLEDALATYGLSGRGTTT